MTSRNAPCPCGSGRKFKHCHGAASLKGEQDPQSHTVKSLRQQVNQLIRGRTPAQLEQALSCLQQWQALQPQSFEVLQRQLEIHLYRGQLESAAQMLESWPGSQQRFPEFAYFRGVLAQLRGDPREARHHYATAIGDQRRSAQLPLLDETAMSVATAIQLCETAAGNYPASPAKSEEGMFASAAQLQELENALLTWEQSAAATRSPELLRTHGNAWYNLGCAALADFTTDDRRIELFRKAVELNPDDLLARFNLAFAHNYSFSADPAQVFSAHRQAGAWLESRTQALATPVTRDVSGAGRMRLAYLSSDFRQHSVAHFILPVLRHHDRNQLEIFVYHNHRQEDGLSQQARENSDHFVNVAGFSDQQLVQRIRQDQIDVLVDLNGLTQHHRLAVLAQQPAAVQVSWIGYPNTTGLNSVGFRVVDSKTDPVGQSEPYSTEKFIRLPESFLAFSAAAGLPEPVPPPCLEKGFVTLGTFNALPKLNPPLLRVWARLMQEIPHSHLLVKNIGVGFAGPRDRIRAIFEQQGIDGQRLIFAGKTDSRLEHLEFYAKVDISLDSFPYNGTTTTCDSLLMGVPVVTRAGSEHRSRVGLSLLHSMGLETMVASDENSLIQIVTDLAANPQELQTLRAGLRTRLLQSPLGNAARLTGNLEHELKLAWERRQAGKGNP
ncbi:MAG TPA: SEC-C metal-binding domain-containing protein [Xanthomonadales bacterium]|nr:SEC-C metal-binding domain-containing protein [Xanthomonadales bacterium]